MKVAVFSESGADEAAIRILVEGLLGQEAESPSMPGFRSRGWNAVLRDLPMVLRHLHFQTDAQALVAVIDSDRSPVHTDAHRQPGGAEEKCRLCQVIDIVDQVQRGLRPRDPYGPLRIALGLAVPQVEAWYLVGRNPHVNEGAWARGLKSGKLPYTGGSLKQQVYGTDEPPIGLEEERAVEEARRIVDDGGLESLERLFPDGFGRLAKEVRSWRGND